MNGNMGSITIGTVTANDVSHESESGLVPRLDIHHTIKGCQLHHSEVVRLRNWLSDWIGHHEVSAERVSAYAKMVHEKADAAKLVEQAKEVDKVYGTAS